MAPEHRITTGQSGSRHWKIEADMELRFQPALLQEVIDSFVEKPNGKGIPPTIRSFHELADPIYEKSRSTIGKAVKLYQYLFGTGFSDIIRDAFNEYPLVEHKIGIKLVKGVLKEDQEGVDILRNGDRSSRTSPSSLEEKGSERHRYQAYSLAVL